MSSGFRFLVVASYLHTKHNWLKRKQVMTLNILCYSVALFSPGAAIFLVIPTNRFLSLFQFLSMHRALILNYHSTGIKRNKLKSKPVKALLEENSALCQMFLFPNPLITDIEEESPSAKDLDFHFPIVQAEITECSTYAVVCRLKPSPPYSITSNGGSFNVAGYSNVCVTIPKKAVPPKVKIPLELKVVRFACTREWIRR